jgi:hypothetical protein
LMLEKKVPGYVGATIITQGGTDSANLYFFKMVRQKPNS